MWGHYLNLTVVAPTPTWQNSRCMCHSSTGTKMASSLLLKLSKVWSHFSAARELYGIILFFLFIYFCTLDDTQDLLLSDVKLLSPPRLHRQFILLSLLWPTLYALSPWLYPVSKYLLSEFRTRSASFLPLQPGALPPYINIYVEYIHKAIHGSDTGAYDSKGR